MACPLNLTGRVALITGGASGLGKGFAESILSRGGQVCIADLNGKLGLDTAAEFTKNFGPGRCLFVKSDVTKAAELEAVFNTTNKVFGNIDIVANNAGIGDENNWEKMVNINLVAVIRGCKLAVQYMSLQHGGRGGVIVNTASTAGLTATEGGTVYSSTKHGVVGLSRSLALTLGDPTLPVAAGGHGIRVTCICPSFTNTPLFTKGDEERGNKGVVHSLGVMEVGRVVEGFVKLLEESNNNGGVLAVTPKSIVYKFPKHLQSKY